MRALFLFVLCLFPLAAHASQKPVVVASFSIIGDMVSHVGGDLIELKTLVGPDGDAHEYEPTPADARLLAGADLVVMNGLGYEGWMQRLTRTSGYKGELVETGSMITALPHDPHAWQDLGNSVHYISAISEALARTDRAHAEQYKKNALAYMEELAKLDGWVRAELAKIPREQRKVITSHDAFAYFGRAYGVTFLAPQGLSTDAQPSAAGVAKLIDQLRGQKVRIAFIENMTDPRLVQQLEKDAGASLGGTLYSDALSGKGGPAESYTAMFEHNVRTLIAAMRKD